MVVNDGRMDQFTAGIKRQAAERTRLKTIADAKLDRAGRRLRALSQIIAHNLELAPNIHHVRDDTSNSAAEPCSTTIVPESNGLVWQRVYNLQYSSKRRRLGDIKTPPVRRSVSRLSISPAQPIQRVKQTRFSRGIFARVDLEKLPIKRDVLCCARSQWPGARLHLF